MEKERSRDTDGRSNRTSERDRDDRRDRDRDNRDRSDRDREYRRDDRRDERDRRDYRDDDRDRRDNRDRRDDRSDRDRKDRDRRDDRGDSRREQDRMDADRKYADAGKRDRAHDERDDRRGERRREADGRDRKHARRDESPPPKMPDFYFTASQIAARICELFPHLSQKLPLSRDFRDCFFGVGTIPGGEETKGDAKQGTREAATVTFHEANKAGVDRGFESTLRWNWSDYEKAILESKEIPKNVEPCKQIAVESNDRGNYTFAIDFYAGNASPFGLGLKGDHVVAYAAWKNQITEIHVIEDIEGVLPRDCQGLRASKTWLHVGLLMNTLQKEVQRRAASGQEWTFNYNNYQTMQDSAGLGLGVSSAFVTWKEDRVYLGKDISN